MPGEVSDLVTGEVLLPARLLLGTARIPTAPARPAEAQVVPAFMRSRSKQHGLLDQMIEVMEDTLRISFYPLNTRVFVSVNP